jgi:hypothetical protein
MSNVLILAESGFSDIRGIISIPAYWPWLVLAAALILIAIAAYWWQSRNPVREVAAAPVEPPHLKAKRLLDQLSQSGDQLEAEVFTVKVSSILRHYLEEALAIPAPEQTSEEFLQNLSDQSWITADLQNDLEEFMIISDLVKFARQTLDATQRQRLLSSALQVVETTQPQPEPVSH